MFKHLSPGHCRLAIKVFAMSAAATWMSGCSSDATRFSDPFGNPFTMSSNDSGTKHQASLAKTSGVGRAPPVVAQALPPKPAVVVGAAPRPVVVSTETTGSIAPPHVATAGTGAWAATGGASVVVAQGETADMLAKRYGVPETVFLQVNGLKKAADLQPGARIVVPVYNAVATIGTPAPAAAVPHVVAEAAPAALPHVLAPPPKVILAAKVREPLPAVVRLAKSEAPPRAAALPVRSAADPVRKGKVRPAVQTASLEPATKAKPAPVAPVRTALAPAAPPKPAAVKTVPLKPAAPAKVPPAAVKPAEVVTAEPKKLPDPAPAAAAPPAAPAVEAAAGPEFRWPARGRIIQGFKGGAGGNDGINIAVPEGTAVKAAEGGVVAYAGSELKGYGNLVLIRHPNGFVSAYANNGEIDVKRGDTVKRGQVIAKSGQTGNVASPQLHFELRKGSQPVDPTSYLAGL
jgi:murein DD-endopeptidase MepM/ murein hydrolase activator NlpD